MWNKVYGVVEKVIEPVTDTIDAVHTSEEEKIQAEKEIEKVKNDLTKEFIDLHEKELEAKKEIIVAEAKGGWLQRNWRPIFMLVVIIIIANNYIIAPYVPVAEVLDLPSKLWNVIMIGLGGYLGDGIAGKLSPNHDSTKRD